MNKAYFLPKIVYQCRRGMLELDVILIPFAQQYFMQMDERFQNDFVLLLEEADPDIYTWLMGFGAPKPEFESIISHIRKTMASKETELLQ
jgi:antitoxin CptB